MIVSGIANFDDIEQWEHLYSMLDVGTECPFHSPEYHRAYAKVEEHQAECFWVYENDENFLFYPYLLRSINALGYDLDEQYFDIGGVYGYNGPIGKVSNNRIVEFFNTELQAYLQKRNVVTEFVRYCPIVNGREYHSYPNQIDVLDSVFIDLSKGIDWVWNESFEYRVRKTVRKGEAHGLITEIKPGDSVTREDIESFYSIYASTMRRNQADEFYYFPIEYFNNLFDLMPHRLVYVVTKLQSNPISVELILVDGENAFGFLGGTLSEYYSYKPNTFQRWELLKYLVEAGVKKYSMGGGAKRGDGIYDFKLSFAKGCSNSFYIGLHTHNLPVYAEIKRQWRAIYPSLQDKEALLQCYRIQE